MRVWGDSPLPKPVIAPDACGKGQSGSAIELRKEQRAQARKHSQRIRQSAVEKRTSAAKRQHENAVDTGAQETDIATI
ncbi:MAG: hypothetical protein ACLP5V_10670 [Candidatus Bathyarchaeia archaeon]